MINKPLLLHLFGVYIIYINDTRSNKYQIYDTIHTLGGVLTHVPSLRKMEDKRYLIAAAVIGKRLQDRK